MFLLGSMVLNSCPCGHCSTVRRPEHIAEKVQHGPMTCHGLRVLTAACAAVLLNAKQKQHALLLGPLECANLPWPPSALARRRKCPLLVLGS